MLTHFFNHKKHKFLEICNLLKLNFIKAQKIWRPILNREIEVVIKISQYNDPRTIGFEGKFYQIFKEELLPTISNSSKIE
jgi:hypothetical protein